MTALQMVLLIIISNADRRINRIYSWDFMRILAGDIGGTNARLAYLDDDSSKPTRIDRTYASIEYSCFEEILGEFFSSNNIQPRFDAVCIAIAGPVLSGCAAVTNLPWKLCESSLSSLLQTKRVCLINDLVAVAHAIPCLQEKEVVFLQQGAGDRNLHTTNGSVIVAVGTGLGAAHLKRFDAHLVTCSSEAGHTGFSPETTLQETLLHWLHRRHSHVSKEMLLSGRGIYTLYRFFRDHFGLSESDPVKQAIQHSDPARVISEHAIIGDDQLCIQTLECFAEILGAVAGDIVLHYYPVDTLYLAGGIPAKILPFLKQRTFIEAFCNKGPMRSYLSKIEVKLVLTELSGLNGAIVQAKKL